MTDNSTGTQLDWTYELMAVDGASYDTWTDIYETNVWTGCQDVRSLPTSATSTIAPEVAAIFRVDPTYTGSPRFRMFHQQTVRKSKVDSKFYLFACHNSRSTVSEQHGQTQDVALDFGQITNASETWALDATSEAVGGFARYPIENDWHDVEVTVDDDGALTWSNAAGVSWSLRLANGFLYTNSDCPYGIQQVDVESDGNIVTALWFLGERYALVGLPD
ncbi:MAG: hypothetical protein R3F59_16500 [Myxococcota bacterium]